MNSDNSFHRTNMFIPLNRMSLAGLICLLILIVLCYKMEFIEDGGDNPDRKNSNSTYSQ